MKGLLNEIFEGIWFGAIGDDEFPSDIFMREQNLSLFHY
jgi:hypothetical protein